MDKYKLKSVMILNKDTNITLSKALNISPQCLSTKINERRNAEFTQREIKLIKDRYNLTSSQLDDIFFTTCVS